MATFSLFLLSLLSLISSSSQNPFFLPITKNTSTLQYSTTLSHGTPLTPTNLILDLGGSLPWVHCSSIYTPSSSLYTIPHRSLHCLTANIHHTQKSWLSKSKSIDQDYPCRILPENTITGKLATEGELVQDIVTLQSRKYSIFELLFTCSSNTFLLNGLSIGAKGVLGLGKSRSSFSSQLFNSINSQRKITLCLSSSSSSSSSSGFLLLGNTVKVTAFESQPEKETLRSLTFTPLVKKQDQEYFINVNSIKIGGKRVSFNTPSISQEEGYGGTKLSTIVPYTTMQSSIYANFKSAFSKAALSMNMTRVSSVTPFELCFGGSHVGVPVIEFVLQSEMVKWRIYERHSMVKVNDDVMCLGFLDGGVKQRNPIVIGGYQMEDVLVQLDLDTNMVGFSSRGTSCSNFRFGSNLPAQSI